MSVDDEIRSRSICELKRRGRHPTTSVHVVAAAPGPFSCRYTTSTDVALSNDYMPDGEHFYGTDADLLLRSTFATYEGYIGSAYKNLPVTGDVRYGFMHTTRDASTAAATIGVIDNAIAQGEGIQLVWHSHSIGVGSSMSIADFRQSLTTFRPRWHPAAWSTSLMPSEFMCATECAQAAAATGLRGRESVAHKGSVLPHAGFSLRVPSA